MVLKAGTRFAGAALLAILLAGGALLSCAGCSFQKTTEYRGAIETADGVVLATSTQKGSSWVREYPQGDLARQLLGDRNADEGSEGLEDQYAEDLQAGSSLRLTIDSGMQKACDGALAGKTGTVVVLDPDTGAVLAMASHAQAQNGQAADAAETLQNRAVHARVPGSTFKTITLVSALQSGTEMSEQFGAPATLSLRDGNVTNAAEKGYGELSLSDAYALSVNTVFAQISLGLGVPALQDEAREFGFDAQLAQDFACEQSTIENADSMNFLGQAWCGVGQALFLDGETFGPVATPLQMASIAAVFANGGTLYAPYVIAEERDVEGESVRAGEKKILNSGFVSSEIIDDVRAGMRKVVESGTGAAASVPGVFVAGKTGTAETSSLKDDGWFMGFATKDDRTVSFCVCLQDAASADAAAVAADVVGAIFGTSN